MGEELKLILFPLDVAGRDHASHENYFGLNFSFQDIKQEQNALKTVEVRVSSYVKSVWPYVRNFVEFTNSVRLTCMTLYLLT